jgi:hypothetical protein
LVFELIVGALGCKKSSALFCHIKDINIKAETCLALLRKGYIMKKKIVLLVILVIGFAAGNALANDLRNPGFELGAIGRFDPPNVTYWTTFDTNGWHHSDTWCGAVHSGAKAVKLWSSSTYIYQDFSVIAGNRYDFSVYAYAYSGDNTGLYGMDAFFQVKWYNAGNALILADVIGYFYADPLAIPYHAPDPYDTWKFISGSRTAPSTAVTCRVFMGLTVGSIGWKGSINWDDASVTSSYGASNPEPADGALDLVPFEVNALSWDRPAPRHTGDSIKCDVWFGTDGNMPGTNTKILNKQDANSVAISSPLASHQNYYWRVDCYDPNGSGPEIKSEGQTWTFNTADNCGSSYMLGDINGDCYVNSADLEEMVANWLKCNDVSNPQCQ